MRILSIDELTEHMQLARSIYSAEGKMLLAEGTYLTRRFIGKLKKFGISTLYIDDYHTGKTDIDELVKVQTKNEATKITKEIMTKIRKGETLYASSNRVYDIVNDIMKELCLHHDLVLNLIEMRVMNDYHFSHNVAVCVLSIMTGISLGYDDLKLSLLGIGAILHDIGKAKIPLGILNKRGKLTTEEYEKIKLHTQKGHEILKECKDIHHLSAAIAWQHHERMDGSGYPCGLKGSQISEFARVVAVADVYDAMSTDRIYRKRYLPHEVIEYIRDQKYSKFDPELTLAFLQNIAPFPIGCNVMLNTGEQGVVTKVTKDFLARPVVRIIFDKKGTPVAEPFEKDLKNDLTSFILKVKE
jgi:HD-GYP domain